MACEDTPHEQTENVAAHESPKKRKHGGKRSTNKAEGTYEVTTLDPADWEPVEPMGVHAKWRNRCGVVVREKCKITWTEWKLVPQERKEEMWNAVRSHILFPPADLEKAKKATLTAMSHIFREWRSRLNCRYVKRGITPFDDYGQISPQDWEEFVQQKTARPAKDLSAKMLELNRKNKYKPHLGPGGYKKKIPEWKAMEEKLRAEGKPDPLEGLEPRAKNWVHAHSKMDENGEINLMDAESAQVI